MKKIVRTWKRIWKRLVEERFSPYFIFSALLLRSSLPLPFRFRFYHNLYLNLCPSSIALGLWRKKYSIWADIFVIESIVQEHFICLDIGANIGHLSLIMAKKAKKGMVFAIEPSHKAFSCLLKNIQINHMHHIIPLNIGISTSNGIEVFYEYPYADDQSSLEKGKAESRGWKIRPISVIIFKLNHLLDLLELEKVDFLKIDVEGAELRVIQSLEEKLCKVRYIWFEFIEENFQNFGYLGKEIFHFLHHHNFAIKKLEKDSKEFKEIQSSSELPSSFQGNLLAVNKNML